MKKRLVKLTICFILGALSCFLSSYNKKEPSTVFHVVVTADLLNVRKGPGISFPITDQVKTNTTFSVLDTQGEWYAIELEKRTGWISSRHVVKTSASTLSPHQQEARAVVKPTYESDILQSKTIVLDAGHGGNDKGAIGIQGTYEKDLTLRTVLMLEKRLKEAGATVLLTRQDDSAYALSNRVLQSRTSNADAFLSIHYNSIENAKTEGIMTYYYKEKRDYLLASHIQEQLISSTFLSDKKVRFGDYYVLRENNKPSALIELGFLSNRNEETYINSLAYQRTITTSIIEGLIYYFTERSEPSN
ncbi:N-acetylmuramoyl-L-alanine amidase [Bacillus sp. CGMCC 1.16541]|uniref:N-acetylmuramoyl-L-alanine amidase n=1 Tax=Bacillus sp. CGMCC 1.16541 TaxID=2185143 RepID=UPI000D72B021|nr:N-acetylmuramoyl-L-alanine amidase [Bacillus sp. CGMCC 1.16541]